jgi:hypothetical protein
MYGESERSSPFGAAPRGNETFYLRVERDLEAAQHREGDFPYLFLSLPSSFVIPFDDIVVNNKNLRIFLFSKRKAPGSLGLLPFKIVEADGIESAPPTCSNCKLNSIFL